MESDLRLLFCGQIAPHPNWCTPRHSHNHHELIVVVRGKLQVAFDSETIEAKTGDLLFYKAGQFHAERSDPVDPVETRFLAFSFETAGTWTWNRIFDRDGRVRELASWLERDWQSSDPAAQPTRSTFALAILAECQRLSSYQEEPFLATVHQFMDETLNKVITLQDLASTVKLSPFHFIRRYRSLMGRPPMAELRRRRLEAARHLLATTDLPMSNIAQSIGLVSVPHLSRLFRQQFGITPGEIRRSLYRGDFGPS